MEEDDLAMGPKPNAVATTHAMIVARNIAVYNINTWYARGIEINQKNEMQRTGIQTKQQQTSSNDIEPFLHECEF